VLYFRQPTSPDHGDRPNARFEQLELEHLLLAEEPYCLRRIHGREGKARSEQAWFTDEAAAREAAVSMTREILARGLEAEPTRDPWFSEVLRLARAPVAHPPPVAEPEPEPVPLLSEGAAETRSAQPPHGFTRAAFGLRVPERPPHAEDFLEIFTSNHLPNLLDQLADRLAADPLDPLIGELVVVQSTGMQRWITLSLARKWGVAASFDMPFPARFFDSLAKDVLGEEGEDPMEDNPFADRNLLAWSIYGILPECARDSRFADIGHFLDDDPHRRKRYQLAVRLASCFDDYQIYRPELINAWLDGLDEGPEHHRHVAWQAELMRRLVRAAGRETRLSRYGRLLRALASNEDLSAVLPERISLFGVSTLPPLFLELIGALARHIPVGIYFVSPTWEYWADIRSEREQSRLRHRFKRPGDPNRFATTGNKLLASFGQQGRSFFRLLDRADSSGSAMTTLDFTIPGYDSMLHALQADVLHLIDRGRGTDRPRFEAGVEDRSIRAHGCHGPMREMEVLRDQLLACFEAMDDLKPEDVLVMVPDIGDYAPYIQAVFGVARDPRLPFSIADRAIARERPLADALLRVLAVVRSRMGAGEVLDLLEVPAVRRRFEIGEEDLAIIRYWVEETRIRWGVDGPARARDFDLPDLDDHTWRKGLERLLMGYAVGEVDQLVADVLPFGEDGTGHADLLGSFAQLTETLFRFVSPLRRAQTLSDWVRLLTELINQMFSPGSFEEDEAMQMLRDVVASLEKARVVAGIEEAVPLAVVQAFLERRFGEEEAQAGFITGRITFCSLKPMRTIPYRVICIAGLGDGAFPRANRSPAFDLIAAQRRDGDRSPREDDRYLFLETLLAARDRLIMTFMSRSIVDNTEMAASSVLEELLDHLDASFAFPEGKTSREHLVVHHPLQAFSPRYFRGDPELFSYSAENHRAAVIREHVEKQPFIGAPLEGREPLDEISLDDLVAFWREPSKLFCTEVLGAYPRRDERPSDDVEPFALDDLDRYKLHETLLTRRLRRGETDEASFVRATGLLPPANLGEATYARARSGLDPFVAALDDWDGGRTVLIAVSGEGWRISGRVEGLADDHRVQLRPSSIKAKDLVRAWINHLAIAADAGPDTAAITHTRVIGTSKDVKGFEEQWLGPVESPIPLLDALIEGYRQGLREPLPFFPSTSEAYARARRAAESGAGRRDPGSAAREKWRGNSFQNIPGDGNDRFVALCFRGRDPLEHDRARFESLAWSFWSPLMDALDEGGDT